MPGAMPDATRLPTVGFRVSVIVSAPGAIDRRLAEVLSVRSSGRGHVTRLPLNINII